VTYIMLAVSSHAGNALRFGPRMPVKIPAYKVQITDVSRSSVVVDKTLTDGPTNDDRSLVEHTYGADWERVRVRHKTDEGDMRVIFRWLNGGSYVTQELDAKPDHPVEVQKPNGARFRVDVLALPEDTWKAAEALEFKAPKVTVQRQGNGWNITFEPGQKPCVCTVAVDGATKPETLPSIPFATHNAATKGSMFISDGEFGAEAGKIIRLGVRGAGLSVRVKLPADEAAVEVKPDTFERNGSPNPTMLQDAYVQQKAGENAALIAARVRYQ
jgi:hypothetical protein